MKIRPCHAVFIAMLFMASVVGYAKTQTAVRTQIVLDHSTFPKISRPLLQETAEQVAQVVDQLIPGGYPTSNSATILCFVAPEKWSDRPRALIGKPWKVEPPSARNYAMRVSVTPNVLPGAWQRFAFQLAHELAHLKMDGRVDNNVFETFAVAISLEVLHRLGYDGFRESNEKFYTQWVPSEVRKMLAEGDRVKGEWKKIGMYLRYEWRREHTEDWDQSTQFIGAIAIRKIGGFPWERLLDIGSTAACGTRKPVDRAQYCPLTPATLADFQEQFRDALGQDAMSILLARRTNRRPEPDAASLVFREKGGWVSLRYVRKIDSDIPAGFLPVD